jgi:benzoyl-CoA reductase/2-hydroxyglutaryl-CoA dehydratase subunit BcrC/BadD/HgdB
MEELLQKVTKGTKGITIGWAGGIYVPEVLIHAAGFLPKRILGAGHEISLGEVHLQTNVCHYVKRLIHRLLSGECQIDGLVIAHTCDAMVKSFDVIKENWQRNKCKFYLLDFPHILNKRAEEHLVRKFESLKEWLMAEFDVRITNEMIWEAINLYYENRRLLKQIYALRKENPPLLSGSEAMELVISSMVMRKDEHNRLLRHAMNLIKERDSTILPRAPRIILSGGPVNDVSITRLIEECGANIVCEDLCTGHRYFNCSTEILEGDPLRAIARQVLFQPRSPYLHPSDRSDYLLGLVEEYKADRVILYTQQFCDPHLYEMVWLEKVLQGRGINTLRIVESGSSLGAEQMKTRIEAFLETS